MGPGVWGVSLGLVAVAGLTSDASECRRLYLLIHRVALSVLRWCTLVCLSVQFIKSETSL